MVSVILLKIMFQMAEWNVVKQTSNFPRSVIGFMQAITLPCSVDEKVPADWIAADDEFFLNGLAYRLLLPVDEMNSNSIIPLIWSWKGCEIIKLRVWKIGSGILMTNVNKKR